LFAQDTNYVKPPVYKDNIRISTGVVTQHIDLLSTAHGNDVASSVLVPNVNNNLRFGLNWHFLSLSYTTHIPNYYFNPAVFGSTKYNDFSLNFYGRMFGCEMSYRSYDGLFSPNRNYTDAIKRPDVSFLHTGISLFFFGNSKKFSYRSAFCQNRVQRKSAGGFVMIGEFSYKKLKGDSSFIQPQLDRTYYYAEYFGLNTVGFAIMELKPGYAYNFVFKGGKWYICPFAALGGGVSIYNINTDFTSKYILGLHSDITFRLSAGYDNGKRFFANIAYNSDINSNFFSKTVILNHTTFNLLFTLGLRFGKR
jgi:hypothetical protein